MKIFAIQKTQTNTYSPQYQQNSSRNQNPVTKTNMTGDKFVSKVSFSGKPPTGLTVEQMGKEVARLQKRLDIERLTKAVREDIEDTIERLKVHIEMDSGGEGGTSSSSAQFWADRGSYD